MSQKANLDDLMKSNNLPSEISGTIKKVVRGFIIGGVILALVIQIYPQLLIYLIVACVSAGSFYAARFYSRKYKTTEDTPISRIRSAAQGYVEIEGRFDNIKVGREKAPLSGVPAQFWKIVIERTKRTGRSSSQSITEAVLKSDDSPFLEFSDDTGKCYVLINEAAILGERRRGSALNDAILEILPKNIKDRLFKLSNLTIWEDYLPSDKPVYVKGQLVTLRTNQSPFEKINTSAMSEEVSKYIDDRANAHISNVNKKWFSEMKRIEGIPQAAELQGLEQVNILTSGIDMADQNTLVVTCFDNKTLSKAWRRFSMFYYSVALLTATWLIFKLHGLAFPNANQELVDSIRAIFGMATGS